MSEQPPRANSDSLTAALDAEKSRLNVVNDEEHFLELLRAAQNGEAGGWDKLSERIYEDLRAMARRQLRGGRGGMTIQPTMLASDTLMRLIVQRQQFDNAGHLFAIASRIMMRLLIDHQRHRKALRRGGAMVRVALDPDQPQSMACGDDDGLPDCEQLEQAMAKLAELDPRKAEVVKYRILWSLTAPQTAAALNVSLATVERDWAFAKAWLAKELTQPS